MTKNEAIKAVKALYRVMNASDSIDSPERADWTVPAMTGVAGCAKLDELLRSWLDCGVLTADEHQEIYDTL